MNKLSICIEKIYNLIDSYHSLKLHKFYSSLDFDAVIDVGSHKGEFINKVIRDKSIPIIAFEPQDRVIDELSANVEDFNIVKIFQYAVSNESGKSEIILNKLSSTSSLKRSSKSSIWINFKTFVLGGNLVVGVQKTNLITLDASVSDFAVNYKKILLKIDVEGAELGVLAGAISLLNSKKIALIQFEKSSFGIYEDFKQGEVERFLLDHGYTFRKRFIFPLLNFSDVVYGLSKR